MSSRVGDVLARSRAAAVNGPQRALVDRVTQRANRVADGSAAGSLPDCENGRKALPNVLWFVQYIEDIMKARNLPVGAAFQRRWRTGKYNRASTSQLGMGSAGPLAVVSVSMDWLLSFRRTQIVLDTLTAPDYLLSSNARALMQSRVEALFRATNDKTVAQSMFPDGLDRENLYMQYQSVAISDMLDGGFDDLNASIGRFSLYAIPDFSAIVLGDTVTVTVNRVGVYLRDRFDFEGEQYLGKWSLPDEFDFGQLEDGDESYTRYGSMRPVCPYDEWIFMSNWIYREYRDADGQYGEDFLIYSDLRYVTFPSGPLNFTFPAADWLKPRGQGS